MRKVSVTFYGYLNKLLPRDRRDKPIYGELKDSRSIKDLIEAMGIPHTEVGRILVGGSTSPISAQLMGGEDIHIYPAFIDLDQPLGETTPPPMPKKFILDVHLGTLAKYMRALGIDTLYENYYSDEEIVETALREGRTILTRDRGILKRRSVKDGYLVKSNKSREQLMEIFINFDLLPSVDIFSRCLRCNGPLEEVAKKEIDHELDPLTRKFYHEFFRCTSCRGLYWKGGHWERMSLFIHDFLTQLATKKSDLGI